jgi:hypothetical protein
VAAEAFVKHDPLSEVRLSVAARERAEARYRLALQTARDAGHSGATIAAAAGTTRQNVLKLTKPASTRIAPPLGDAGEDERVN